MQALQFISIQTTHIFYDNGPEQTVRFVFDADNKTIHDAQILRWKGWCSLDDDYAQADLMEWVLQYSVCELEEADIEFHATMPVWPD